MSKTLVNMFGDSGHKLNNKPFSIEVIELDKRYPLGKHIPLEKGDKFVIEKIIED